MKRTKRVLCLMSLTLTAVGCVGQSQMDKLKMSYRKSQEQVIELKGRLEETNERLGQIQNATRNDPNLIAQLKELESENGTLRQKLSDVEQRILGMDQIGPLPAELDQALMELAESNPELMAYDPDLGMVKFQSDLTFDLGSVAIKPAALVGLSQLAKIFNTDVASKYEVRIVGHTDDVPIRQMSTRKLHPTNWHLSVHRSISVKDAISKDGVPANRIGVAGYGEFHPIASNTPRRGNELNRRVEIFLVPRTYKSVVAEAVSVPADDEAGGELEVTSPVVEAPTEQGDPVDAGK